MLFYLFIGGEIRWFLFWRRESKKFENSFIRVCHGTFFGLLQFLGDTIHVDIFVMHYFVRVNSCDL
jgi:hypothetical protein